MEFKLKNFQCEVGSGTRGIVSTRVIRSLQDAKDSPSFHTTPSSTALSSALSLSVVPLLLAVVPLRVGCWGSSSRWSEGVTSGKEEVKWFGFEFFFSFASEWVRLIKWRIFFLNQNYEGKLSIQGRWRDVTGDTTIQRTWEGVDGQALKPRGKKTNSMILLCNSWLSILLWSITLLWAGNGSSGWIFWAIKSQ